MNYKKVHPVLLLLLFPFFLEAQEIVRVEGIGQVCQEKNVTKDMAYQKAEELAMINALNNSFGSYVEQAANILVENGKVNYDIIGNTLVRGEWIRTTDIRFYEDIQVVETSRGKENVIWIKCKINGEARKITSKPKIEALALKCPDINCASEEFMNDQSLYLYFNSPVPGFLSVFIEEGDVTSRLFPYDSQGDESSVAVKGDTKYILFHDNELQNEFNVSADKLVLYASQPLEYNTLHVVFSSEPYIKPLLGGSVITADGFTFPRSLPTEEFRQWMSDCRASSGDFQSVKIRISIRKK